MGSTRRPTPDMGDLLTGGTETEPQERPVSKEEQKKAKEQERIKKRLPRRATYDLPAGMKDEITEIAKENETTASQVAAFLLNEGLKLLDEGLIDLDEHKEESTSIRWKYTLRIDD